MQESDRTIDGTIKGKAALFDLQMETPGWYMVTPQTFTRWGTEYDADGKIKPQMRSCGECHNTAKNAGRPPSKIHSFSHKQHKEDPRTNASTTCGREPSGSSG